MSAFFRRHYARIRNRIVELLHKKDFEDAELLLCLAMAFVSYQFSASLGVAHLIPDHWGATLLAQPTGRAGDRLISDTIAFWETKNVSVGFVADYLGAAALVGLIGLLEEKHWLRIGAMLAGFFWWITSGLLLFLNTPHHAGGGINILMSVTAVYVLIRVGALVGVRESRMEIAKEIVAQSINKQKVVPFDKYKRTNVGHF